LFVAHGVAPRALIIDQLRPTSHERLLEAWRCFLPGADAKLAVAAPGANVEGSLPFTPVTYDERALEAALPEALAAEICRGGRPLVVACHACQHLAQDIIDTCVLTATPFAVCPCCPKDSEGRVQAAAQALGVDLGIAIMFAEIGRLAEKGYDVRLRMFDAAISPQNRILLGRLADGPSMETPGASSEVGGICGTRRLAGAKLRSAYERAQRRRPIGIIGDSIAEPGGYPSGFTGSSIGSGASVGRTRAGLPDVCANASYDEQVRQKCDCIASIFQSLGDVGRLDAQLLGKSMEVRRSPPKHFRARTIVPVGSGAALADDGGGVGGLFRYAARPGGQLELVTTMAIDSLLEPIARALPVLAKLLSDDGAAADLREGLRCAKFHAASGTTPPQLLVCLIYGPGGEVPAFEALVVLRDALASALQSDEGVVEVGVMAHGRGVQRCAPEGKDYVDERITIAGRQAPLKYRQPFGQFSNPNPHIAKATAEWLIDVIQSDINADAGCSHDLLELYCGAGSHTVALAPLFRHVLAVEINRHLVSAAQLNMAENHLENVTVVRAPSEEFCKRVLRRRTYQLRAKDGSTSLQLHFGCTIVDPPRAGLDAITREAISGYDHVLYVSCNPEALKRDLEDLLSTHELRRLVLLDHFPFSTHAEVAVYLRRRDAASGGAAGAGDVKV